MKTVIVFKSKEENVPLSPSSITYHRAVSARPICPEDECWEIVYDDGEVADPATDPLVIGSFPGDGGSAAARVVWNNAIWVPATKAQLEIIYALNGLKYPGE